MIKRPGQVDGIGLGIREYVARTFVKKLGDFALDILWADSFQAQTFKFSIGLKS